MDEHIFFSLPFKIYKLKKKEKKRKIKSSSVPKSWISIFGKSGKKQGAIPYPSPVRLPCRRTSQRPRSPDACPYFGSNIPLSPSTSYESAGLLRGGGSPAPGSRQLPIQEEVAFLTRV